MSKELLIILGILYYVITIASIIGVLVLLNHRNKKSFRKEIDELERDKNLVVSANLIAELNKVEPLVQNSDMKDSLKVWQDKFKSIKEVDVPKVTDELLEAEDLYAVQNYKELKEKLSAIELELYYIKTKANYLLDEIKEITLSEEKNRDTITKLKASYREILQKYNTL